MRPLLETLKGNPGEKVPFWFMRQAGRYLSEYRAIRAKSKSFLDFCYSPDLAVEVTLQPIRRFGMDGAILFSDILVIPDALGQKVWFQPGLGPQLTPVKNEEDINALDPAKAPQHLLPVLETIRRVRLSLPDHVTLLGFAGAPWTVATYMIEGKGSKDHAAARQMGYGQSDLFAKLLEKLVDATSDYLIAQIKAGVDAVQIFDSWSAALPEPAFQAWVIEPTKEIISRVKKAYPDTPVIGFPRLAGSMLETYIDQTGVDAVSLDTGVKADWAATHIQPKLPVQGSLDPHMVVAGGNQMEQEALRLLETYRKGSHVFNLGHGFVPETPVDHVARLSDIIKNFNR